MEMIGYNGVKLVGGYSALLDATEAANASIHAFTKEIRIVIESNPFLVRQLCDLYERERRLRMYQRRYERHGQR